MLSVMATTMETTSYTSPIVTNGPKSATTQNADLLPDYMANSRTHIAPIAKASEAKEITYAQSIPAILRAWGSAMSTGLIQIKPQTIRNPAPNGFEPDALSHGALPGTTGVGNGRGRAGQVVPHPAR
jgi:hypothetical protein